MGLVEYFISLPLTHMRGLFQNSVLLKFDRKGDLYSFGADFRWQKVIECKTARPLASIAIRKSLKPAPPGDQERSDFE